MLSLASFALLGVGCHSYERKPLDPQAIQMVWLGRTAGDQPVREFAARLATAEGRADAVFDPADGLTLAEAEPVALVFNRDLRLARLQAEVTRVRADLAGTWQDPVAGFDIERILSGVSDPWVLSGSIGLTLPISGRLSAEMDRAKADYTAELHRIAALEWATRAALRELWIRYSAHSRRLQLESEFVDKLRAIVDLTTQQASAGMMTRVEARVFRVELAASEASLVQSRGRLKELALQIRDVLGLSPVAEITLVETVSFIARPAAFDPGTIDRGNLELAVVRAEYEVAEAALRLEVRKQYPDLHIAPGYGVDQGDDRILMGLQLPLAIWNRNREGIATAEAHREVAAGRFAGTLESLGSRYAAAAILHDAARSARVSIETMLVPLADEQIADVKRIAELGRVDALLLLQALKSEQEAKLKLVDAHAAESLAAIRLDELAGPPQPHSPTAPTLPTATHTTQGDRP
jgi:outer membrane protein TolC